MGTCLCYKEDPITMTVYAHFKRLAGILGLWVGARDAEVQVADASGNLFQAGTQITATAAQINRVCTGALSGSATLDPTSLVDGAGATMTITVTGAALGDFAMVAAPYDLSGISVTAYVSAASTVSVRIQNESGGTLDLASGTWKALVLNDN